MGQPFVVRRSGYRILASMRDKYLTKSDLLGCFGEDGDRMPPSMPSRLNTVPEERA